MTQAVTIHDLVIRPIKTGGSSAHQRWIALRDTDHLLRRFGQVEVLRIPPGDTTPLKIRKHADEVWSLIEGQVEFVWHDRRSYSPTFDHHHRQICRQPTQVLVPFGVAFGVRAINQPALVVRVSTHDDDPHEGDEVIPFGEAI